jgi:hypothetical protein
MTPKNKANKELGKLTYNTYFEAIPFDKVFDVLKQNGITAVDESGQPWSGVICGESGSTTIAVTGAKALLVLGWYRMQSGRYEVNVYLA